MLCHGCKHGLGHLACRAVTEAQLTHVPNLVVVCRRDLWPSPRALVRACLACSLICARCIVCCLLLFWCSALWLPICWLKYVVVVRAVVKAIADVGGVRWFGVRR